MKFFLANLFFLYLCFGFTTKANAQLIYGYVYEESTKKPIENASVYFNNTTFGTSTDNNGFFTIEYDSRIFTPLVISFLGYEKIIIDDPLNKGVFKIYLREKEDLLDEVFISAEYFFSREEMLSEFRKYYLGESLNAKSSRILNEEDIKLWYNESKKQIRAKAEKPLQIINERLKYKITVSLEHFEINYKSISKNKKRLNVDNTYYTGLNSYESLEADPSDLLQQRREQAYNGSVLHFMRSLSKKKLSENKFKIFVGHDRVPDSTYIKVLPDEHINGVSVSIAKQIRIQDPEFNYSVIEPLTDKFYIDKFGNFTPPNAIRFGGYFGFLKMGDALPLNYKIDEIENEEAN